jgi:hypothetical protein
MVLAQEDYITDAAESLQKTPVYVAAGTEGTDNDTSGKLQTRLDKDDNIVLVMLPASAESELGADISTIATALSEKLENKRIIGLAVGNNVVGYAPTLPAGVAADQMRRARSVSNDPVTTLGTFAQNMHNWQAENPQPKPPPIPSSPEQTEEGGLSWFLWLLIGVGAFLAAIVFVLVAIRTTADNTTASRERVSFKAPDQVKDLLAKIAKARKQVHDRELKEALYQMCLDLEKYFESSSKDKKRDSLFFRDRLTQVNEVLTKYIDVQLNRRYYDHPETELERGKTSIIDFSQFVLKSIRRGRATDLVDYTVNTNILKAQRYR